MIQQNYNYNLSRKTEVATGIFSLLVILFILGTIGYLLYSFVWMNTTEDGRDVRAQLSPEWSNAESQERAAAAAEQQAEAARIQADALSRLARQKELESSGNTPEKP